MREFRRARVIGPLLLAAGVAEGGVRLLAPRERPIEPAELDLERFFTVEEIERGTRFARPQLALALARGSLDLVALAALVSRTRSRRRPRRLRQVMRRGTSRRGPAADALAAAGLAVGGTLLSLPLAAVSRRRARAVGLITQSWRGWAVDVAKQTAIEAVLAGGAGAAALGLMRHYPRGWWLPAAAGSVGLGTVLGALAPVLLDPMFNDFEPLPEGELRSDVLALARSAGVQVGQVYAVDASRRTTGANAYVTGLGPTKRVVLFDTLIDSYSRDEVRVVVAHELSHVRHRDVLRGVAYAGLVAPAAAWAVQRLSWTLSSQRGTAEALPALALATAIITLPTALIGNRLSRALERRADDYSLRLSESPDAFVSFERRIAIQNVADLKPPRWVTSLLASHPPTLQRIGAAVAYSKRAGEGAHQRELASAD